MAIVSFPYSGSDDQGQHGTPNHWADTGILLVFSVGNGTKACDPVGVSK